MLDGGISRLRTHGTLQPADLQRKRQQLCQKFTKEVWTYHKARPLQPKRDQIQEVHKLAKHDAFRRRFLPPQISQLLHQRLDLRARPPCVNVDPSENTLPRRSDGIILFQFECRTFQVDGEWQMTDWTLGLYEKRREQ